MLDSKCGFDLRSRRDRVSHGPSNHRFAVAHSKHPCQAPWWVGVRRDLKGRGRLELLQTREFITHRVMQHPRSTRVLPAPAGTFDAHHTPLAKPAFLQLPTLPAHDSDAIALLHQGPRGEKSLTHSALDAEAFSLLGAEPAALGRCVFFCEVCAREDFAAGETGEAAFFLVSREGVCFDEEVLHLGALGFVVRVDQSVEAAVGL